MNFFTGVIFGVIISTIGLVNVAKWIDKTADSFKHDIVVESAKDK